MLFGKSIFRLLINTSIFSMDKKHYFKNVIYDMYFKNVIYDICFKNVIYDICFKNVIHLSFILVYFFQI